MLQKMPLEKEQTELLLKMVDADRNAPREKRQPFCVYRSMADDTMSHSGLQGGSIKIYFEDLYILEDYGLIRKTRSERSGYFEFIITPLGFQYFKDMKHQTEKPVQRLEETARGYLSDAVFIRKYPTAYQKWAEAESKLWDDNSSQQLTLIGHLCREAMQNFSVELIEIYKPQNFDTDKTKTVSRLKSAINSKKDFCGHTEKEFLNALIHYWGTINDLVQRQEHNSQREDEPLTGEDGRRVVFQTAIVMFEIDRSLSRILDK